MTGTEDPTLLGHAAQTEPATPSRGDTRLISGALLSRYVILHHIGEGGMGVVYAAFDPTLDRKVAVKLMRPQPADASGGSPDQRRLMREARAMAQLSHPNVVAVHDVGTSDERVFVAMEFIHGTTLKQWLRTHAPGWREIVGKFVAAGQGLAAAHKVGLIHRDFKPDNVMVGDDGQIKVLDFGLARDFVPEGDERADGEVPSNLTATGTLMGTPAYMSPEQMHARPLDARTDQFSLCVALFEALCGQRPFSGTSLPDLVSNVTAGRMVELPRGTLPAPLRAAILRGLSIDPDDRFKDMDHLLAALRVRASPRRSRLRWAALGGALTAGVVASRLAAGDDAKRCDAAGDTIDAVYGPGQRQQIASAFADVDVPYAEVSARRVLAVLDAYAERWRAQRRQTCRAGLAAPDEPAMVRALRVSCMQEHRDAVASALDILTQADATIVRNAVELVEGLGPPETCADATLVSGQPPPPNTDDEAGVRRVRALIRSADQWRLAGKLELAWHSADEALSSAAEIPYPPLTPEAQLAAGHVRDTQGHYAQAEQLLRQAHVGARGIEHRRIAMASAIKLIVVVGSHRTDPDAGLLWADLAAAELARNDDPPLARAEYLDHRAQVLQVLGKLAEAETMYREALRLREQTLGEDDVRLAFSIHNLSGILLAQGDGAAAVELLVEAHTALNRTVGEAHPALAQLFNQQGRAHYQLGDDAQAEAAFRRSIAHQEQTGAPQTAASAHPYTNLGILYRNRGDLAAAREAYRRALEIAEAAEVDKPGVSASVWLNLANLELNDGDHAAALAAYHRALPKFIDTVGEEHPHVAITRLGIGETLVDLDRLPEAIEQLQRAESALSRSEFDPAALARTRFILGRTMCAAGRECGRGIGLALQAQGALPEGTPLRIEIERWLGQRPPP